jgi:formylglycine-generating enzyme required for sulfatase activity
MYGHNGGVWEWTSTPLAGYPGYVASELYPGYSSDFFDEKHFVVVRLSVPPSHLILLVPQAHERTGERRSRNIDKDRADDQIGGSYATIPQIASRKSFRNWYQANYPYSFIGGRVVYDA